MCDSHTTSGPSECCLQPSKMPLPRNLQLTATFLKGTCEQLAGVAQGFATFIARN
jgi:hypothetical protein